MSDIPELIRAGYEIYTVKRIPWQARTEGIALLEQFDSTLTISTNLKTELDKLTFFESISEELWALINESFDTLYIDYYKEQFEMCVEHFKGTIILRTLGVPGAGSYCGQMVKDYGLQIFSKIESLVSRFWFAPVYKWCLDKEAQVIRRRYIDLPLSMRCKSEPSSTVFEKRIDLLCPQIRLDEEEEALYENAVRFFRRRESKNKNTIPYIVCGNQYLLCDFDPCITGSIPKDSIYRNLKNTACVYSPQSRMGIVDYYIFLAFMVGAPVIFNAESGLQNLWDDEDAPGACGQEADGERKVERLLSGDLQLRSKIIQWQTNVLNKELNAEKNQGRFLSSVRKMEQSSQFKTHKEPNIPYLGIILLDHYSHSIALQVQSMICSVKQAVKRNKDTLKICIGYPADGEYEYHVDFLKWAEDMGISLREYTVETRNQRWLDDSLKMKGFPSIPARDPMYILNDNNTYFEDCDGLLFVLNGSRYTIKNFSNIITTRPYAVFVPDFDLVEDAGGGRPIVNVHLMRAAKLVLVSGERSKVIAEKDYGICGGRIQVIPTMYTPLSESDIRIMKMFQIDRYFLYFLGNDAPETLSFAVQTLEQYYLQGGEVSAVIVWEDRGKDFRMAVLNSDGFKKKWSGQNKSEGYDDFPKIALPLSLLSSVIENAEFAFLPEPFDLHSQMIHWLIAADVRIVCRNIPSAQEIAERVRGVLNYITDENMNDFPGLLLKAGELARPNAAEPQKLFADFSDNQFYQLLSQSFQRFED